jgi:integrase
MLLDTGLRLSDALDLRWVNVSLDENVIRLVTRKKEKPVKLPLSDAVRTVLEALKKRPVISEFVFLDEDNKPLTKEKVSRKFAMAKAVAGIHRRLRIHDLRHTFASTLVSSGVNLKVVSDLLGHTDLATTARYARGDHRVLADVANVLNRVNSVTGGS